MQTNLAPQYVGTPEGEAAEAILRRCVHCGFCTATCPTFVLLGDERDSPRGRIYLIKDMLENDRPATAEVVKHIDRCLSCLACMTTCPSGVHYMHLVDHARAHIEKTYQRPWFDRFTRMVLAKVLPYPMRFRAALFVAMFAKPLAPLFAGVSSPKDRCKRENQHAAADPRPQFVGRLLGHWNFHQRLRPCCCRSSAVCARMFSSSARSSLLRA